LLLSGGASYHVQQWGLSCDNVINYEIVLANGSIVEANANQHADLFKVLKGGGNNFGIVTRFDMRTFTVPPGGAYGGIIVPSWDDRDAVTEQFLNYASSIGPGSPDHEFVVWRNDGSEFSLMVMPVSTDGNENSTNFEVFDKLHLSYDFRAMQNLSQITESISDTGGGFGESFTLVLQATHEMMAKCAEVFQTLVEDLEALEIPALLTFVFQPLPKNIRSTGYGTNILGLDQTLLQDSILFDTGFSLNATQAAHRALAYSLLGKAVEEIRQYSKCQDGHSSYVYMNYGNAEQDVIGSYGDANVQFMKEVALKYDSAAFFQHRVGGGFKVSRSD
jgi:hypothetical protein